MVIVIPAGVYTMQANRSIVKRNAVGYQRASRKEKTVMLNDLMETTHLNRKHLTVLLNRTGKVYYTPQGVKLVGDPTVTYTHKRGRKKQYTTALLPWLKALWVLSGYRSSLHLKVFINQNQSWALANIPKAQLEGLPSSLRHDLQPLLNIPPQAKAQLQGISSATIERLLKPLKASYKLKHKYKPHPHASVLKKQIPVETHFDKPKGKLGYTELDTVHHCGVRAEGSYCCTLSEVEINTHWSALQALRNKAHQWVERALQANDQTVPFVIHTRHIDNGSEFINEPVFAYMLKHGLRYTRSRPYRKNDSPLVESRHWTLVRSYIGYRCYNTDAEYQALRELMPLISLKHNYFIPTLRTIHKMHVGGKVHKKFEIDTPYNRLLHSPQVTNEKKAELKECKTSLSYLEIIKRIYQLLIKLDLAYQKKYNPIPEDKDND